MKKLYNMNNLEEIFLCHGRFISKYPLSVVFLCIMATTGFSFGLFWFREENDMTALWAPKNSNFRKNVDWTKKNFPQQIR